MINKHQLRVFHRYAGAIVAFFLLFITGTGILLNHTGALKLQDIIIKNPALLHWYGIKPPTLTSIAINDNWVSSDGENLFLNSHNITACTQLINGLAYQNMLLIACSDKLVLSTSTGDIIESIENSAGLPTPVSALFSNNHAIGISTPDAAYIINLDELTFTATQQAPHAVAAKYTSAPPAIADDIIQHSSAYGINLERLLLDIHSGRIAGTLGVLLVDATAVLLLLLAASGLTIWLKKSR